jgi:hypothetical protein
MDHENSRKQLVPPLLDPWARGASPLQRSILWVANACHFLPSLESKLGLDSRVDVLRCRRIHGSA